MLKDLISQLSYSPSAVGQLLFYAKRLRQEEFTRRLGLIGLGLAIVLQSFSFISPPVSSQAASSNDMIGEIRSSTDVIAAMRRDTSIKAVFDEYGITEANVTDTNWTTISSEGHWSVGREQQNFAGEFKLQSGFWVRPLRAWDTGNSSTYRALEGTSSRGQKFWIIETCGNIATSEPGPTAAPIPTPQLTPAPSPSYTIGTFQFTCDKIIGFAQDKRDTPGNIHQLTLAINSPDHNELGRILGVSGNFEHPLPASLRDAAAHQIVIYILEADGTNPGIAYGSVGPCVTTTTTFICPAGGPNAGKAVTDLTTGCPAFPKCPSGPNAGKEVAVVNDTNCPATPTPSLDIHKFYPNGNTVQNGTKVRPGQEITYIIAYKNAGPGVAYDVRISDAMPNNMSFVRVTGTGKSVITTSGQTVSWLLDSDQTILGGDNATKTVEIVLRVNNTATANELLCNVVTISARGGLSRQSGLNEACNTVELPPADCPYKPNVGIPSTDTQRCRPCTALPGQNISFDSPNCPVTADCSFLEAIAPTSVFDTKRQFRSQATANTASAIKAFTYDWGDGTTQTVGSLDRPINRLADTAEHTYAQAGNYTVRLTVQTAFGAKTRDPECVQKISIVTPQAAEVVYDKKVVNRTKNIDDFNGRQADPDDWLEYWLYASNPGDVDARDVTLPTDDLTDTLDYATITDFGDASFNSQTDEVSWGKVTVPAHGQILKKIRFRIKNPLPGTPRNGTRFDSKIENHFGPASVTVTVPRDIAKLTEKVVVTTIPKTGASTNFVFSTIVIMIAAYFYARSRLLKREALILKREMTGSGI